MRRLIIVWWSRTGATRQLAGAAASAARREAGVQTLLRRCDRVDSRLLCSADGLILACPETLGSTAGMMKDFFDRTYYDAMDRLNGRPCGLIVCAGSDGRGAARQMERVVTGWRMRLVAEPLRIVIGAQTPEAIAAPKTVSRSARDQARGLGAALAAGLSLGVW